ncbi:MAG: hypothetical protein ACRCYO_06150, partial [Bacteroidia bacterium]
LSYSTNAQTTCTSCSITITGIDSTDHTVSTGQTLCIAEGAVVTGTLTISGGTVCNAGELMPDIFLFTQGTLINSGLITLKKNLTLASGATITNETNGVMTLIGNLSFASNTAQLHNAGVLTTTGNITTGSGTVLHTGVINCRHLNSSSTFSGTGSVNQSHPN